MRRTRRLSLAVLLLVTGACQVSGEHSGENSNFGSQSEAISGAVTITGCTDKEAEWIRTAVWYGRVAAQTNAFSQCLSGTFGSSEVLTLPWNSNSHLLQGTPGASTVTIGPYLTRLSPADPFSDFAHLYAATQSTEAISMNCNGGAGAGKSEAGIGSYPAPSEALSWTGDGVTTGWLPTKFLELIEPACSSQGKAPPSGACKEDRYPFPIDRLVGLVWHEAMHQWGYQHRASAGDPVSTTPCGYSPSVYQGNNNSANYIVQACLAQVIRLSAANCGFLDMCADDSTTLASTAPSKLLMINNLTDTTCTCQSSSNASAPRPDALRDSDRDGVPDYQDNCPLVQNQDQQDSNKDSERKLSGIPGFDCHRPLPSDTQAYVVNFHTYCIGDACDPDPTTAVQPKEWTVASTGGSGCTLTAGSLSCSGSSYPITADSNLELRSYIGTLDGNAASSVRTPTAPQTTGTTVPVFCKCTDVSVDGSVSSTCQAPPFNCSVADDHNLPPAFGGDDLSPTYLAISLRSGGTDSTWGFATETHRQFSDFLKAEGGYVDSPDQGIWDFLNDLAEFGYTPGSTKMQGVLRTHEGSYNPTTSRENNVQALGSSRSGINNSYLSTSVEEYTRTIVGFAPTIPEWEDPHPVWTPGPSDMPWWTVVNTSYGGPYVVEQWSQSDARVVNSQFSSRALTLLAGVPGGTAHVLPADDGTSGLAFPVGKHYALVLNPAGSQFLGALKRAAARGMDADVPSSGVALASGSKVYAGSTDQLWNLSVSQPGQSATLAYYNVGNLVNGNNLSTGGSVNGAVPNYVAAIGWSAARNSVFVLDAVGSLSAPSNYRLLEISSTTGTSTEIWRSAASPLGAGYSINNVRLTSSAGELILAFSVHNIQAGTNFVDVVTMTQEGNQLASFTTAGTLIGRVYGDAKGYDVPLSQTQGGSGYSSTLNRTKVARSAATKGWGGSAWFGSACLGCGNAPIPNAGFEAGTLASWWSTGTALINASPHTGSYSAQVGSTSPSTDSTLVTMLTVPVGVTQLRFYYKVVCPDTITYDWFNASFIDENDGGPTTTILGNTCSNTGTWQLATVDVSSRIGHSLQLTFLNHDDDYYADPTYTLIDDVSFQ